MTRLDELTQSPDRSVAVLAMVGEALREGNASFENVASKTGRYNKTFGELYEDEYQAALAMLQPAEFDPADVQVEPASTGESSPVEPATNNAIAPTALFIPDQDTPIMTREEANAELQRRKEAHMAARKARMLAEADVLRARNAVEAAAAEWVRGGPSSDEIRRAEIAAINRDRGNKVEQAAQRRPGPSRIDHEAFYSDGHDAASYARKQHRFGWHRATALTPGGLLQRPGRRGAKLPSEV